MRKSLSETSSATRGEQTLLWSGLIATALIAVWALVDPLTGKLLARQVQEGYPSYSAAEASGEATIYMLILVTVGVLGVLGWITTLLLIRKGKRAAAVWTGSALCIVGILLAVTGLTMTDESGVVGLAPAFGWALLVPCVLGVLAIIAMWRKGAR